MIENKLPTTEDGLPAYNNTPHSLCFYPSPLYMAVEIRTDAFLVQGRRVPIADVEAHRVEMFNVINEAFNRGFTPDSNLSYDAPNTINLRSPQNELILTITVDGFIYRGQVIPSSNLEEHDMQVYRAFQEFLCLAGSEKQS